MSLKDYFTIRQINILVLLMRGLTSKELPLYLTCSPGTINFEIRLIKALLHAKNTTNAVAIALALNIITPDSLDQVDWAYYPPKSLSTAKIQES